ncbi:DUF3301 domain-containing protein [Pseudomethylobacillus aquaticus]|uniref:DUF3301 domain-containing protein n=1 Tax=Pseudomethylobacillus aquaticus TaxID=2676064 RepID=A0A3N0V6C8_9PROT|nr:MULTISPECIES: DUF3301 domain-containing protein [Methylophilaceae]ROH88162.1 DUF3301 domain-containing protein [Pseudomethylobacillus aquaticus]
MEIYLIIALALTALYWMDSIASRDNAVILGKELAARYSLQLLDETVACNKLRLGRNSRGHVQLQRTYQFELSANGTDRMACELTLLGRQLHSWHIPPYLEQVH